MAEHLASGSFAHGVHVTASGTGDSALLSVIWRAEQGDREAYAAFAIDETQGEAIALHLVNGLQRTLTFEVMWRGNSTRSATVLPGETQVYPIPNGIRKWLPTAEGIDSDVESFEVY